MKILYAGAIGQKDTATAVHVLRNARLLEKWEMSFHFAVNIRFREKYFRTKASKWTIPKRIEEVKREEVPNGWWNKFSDFECGRE